MSKVKFGDIVKDVKFNVDRDNNPYEFYVAGDHMDSEDLNIRRRGRFATDDVGPAFTRIFKKGQVLYGSRRTYLKKVAVADFDGICANTTFVFESKDPAAFEQRLLPFLMLSEGFTNWSIAHSKGSTNPYVLFSVFSSYEFYLPSLAEQKVLAEKLWAAYEVKQSYLKMIAATEEMVKSQFIEMFGDPIKNSHKWDIASLSALGELKNGMNFSTNENGCKIKCLGVSDFKERNKINSTEISSILSLNSFPSEDYLLKDDDIIFVRSNGNKNLVGRCMIIISSIEPLTFSGFCIRLRLNSLKVMSEFLLFLFKHPSIRQQIAGRGANINNLNQKVLSALPIIVPPMEFQQQFVAFFHQADKSVIELRKSVDAIDKVIKSLINENL